MDDPYLALSNIELEKSLLQALFVYPEKIPLIDLDPEDFYDHRHRTIYESMKEMDRARIAVDIETINNHLIGRKLLEKAGGFLYLADIHGGYGIAANPEDYATGIADLSTRRRAFRTAHDLARAVLDRGKGINETLNEFSAAIPRLVRSADGARHVSHYASLHYDRMKEALECPGEAARRILRTGFLDFDRCTIGGLRLGELMLLLGKPGLGKTKWLHQMGAQLACNGYPGAIFQAETGQDEIMDREVSRYTRIPTERLEVANLTDEEWTVYTAAIDAMSAEANPLYLNFGNRWNTVTLRAELTRLKAERGIQWFAFDYLRFLRDQYGESETERENFISIQLKTMCKELDIAGVVIHSMNKSGIASSAPDMEHSSGGAAIPFDCDKLLFMSEYLSQFEGDEKPNMRTFYFRKSRRKLAGGMFDMIALEGYPAFGDVQRAEPPARQKAPATPRIKHVHTGGEDG